MNLLKSPALPRVNSSDLATVAACVFVFAAAIVSYTVDHRLSGTAESKTAESKTALSKTALSKTAEPAATGAVASSGWTKQVPSQTTPAPTVPVWTAGWTLRGGLAPEDNPLRGRESRRLKTMLAEAG